MERQLANIDSKFNKSIDCLVGAYDENMKKGMKCWKGTEIISENKMTSVIDFTEMVALLLQILHWSLISLFCPKIGAVQSTSKKSGGGIAALLINHGQSS